MFTNPSCAAARLPFSAQLSGLHRADGVGSDPFSVRSALLMFVVGPIAAWFIATG